MGRTLKDDIIEQVDRLALEKQQKVLNFARGLDAPTGTPGRELLIFAGAIDPQDLEEMSLAIQQGCEQVEPNAW